MNNYDLEILIAAHTENALEVGRQRLVREVTHGSQRSESGDRILAERDARDRVSDRSEELELHKEVLLGPEERVLLLVPTLKNCHADGRTEPIGARENADAGAIELAESVESHAALIDGRPHRCEVRQLLFKRRNEVVEVLLR